MALTLLPAFALAYFIAQLAVDVSAWDQWALTFRIDALFDGRFTLGDLTAPDHEHAMPVPLAIMFTPARFTHWDLAMEPWVHFLIGLATFSVVALQFQRAQRQLGRKRALACWPVLALLTGIGRLDHGVEQALASRYISFATPFWVAVVSLLGLDLPVRARHPLHRLGNLTALAVIWLMVVASSFQALPVAREHSARLRDVRQRILAARDTIPEDPSAFAGLLTDPAVHELLEGLEGGQEELFQTEHRAEIETLLVRYGLVVLKKHKLSVFREP